MVAEESCRYPTIDLVAVLRARSLRSRWAGRELRKTPEESLVHQILVAVAEHDLQLGKAKERESLLMDIDAPSYESVEELLPWQTHASDLHGWASAVRELEWASVPSGRSPLQMCLMVNLQEHKLEYDNTSVIFAPNAWDAF